jgi:hypothetical protein
MADHAVEKRTATIPDAGPGVNAYAREVMSQFEMPAPAPVVRCRDGRRPGTPTFSDYGLLCRERDRLPAAKRASHAVTALSGGWRRTIGA